jgi:Domain of unknown function (DUF4082)/Divergent InlB B-repeat domain
MVASLLILRVDVASAAQLTLQWVDNAGGTSTFKVERKTGTGGTYAQIGTTTTGAMSYVDSSVATNTTYCYRVKASNSAGDSSYSNEACGSVTGTFDVTIAKAGTGNGTVTSNPPGINCGTDCFQSFTAGTVVTLSATPASGSTFTDWSGGGCSGTAPCTTSGNTAVTMTANFSSSTSTSYTLNVTKSGTGAGTVTSSLSGINCGTDCSQAYTSATTVTLTAAPASGSTFSGWSSGGCSGTATTCTIAMTASRTVNAAFTASTSTSQRYTLWPSTAVPSVPAYPDRNAVTVGMKFRSDVAGYLTGVRFYKGSANTGTHVGSLWSASGSRLATVTFSGETASGWQEATFSTPVSIAANTTYVVSYHTRSGYYAVNGGYFNSQSIYRAPLRAPSTGSVGGNGVFRYGTTNAFPNSTYKGNNYWVDVVFVPR